MSFNAKKVIEVRTVKSSDLFYEDMPLICRKMSNCNLLCYSRIGSMMEEKGDEHNGKEN